MTPAAGGRAGLDARGHRTTRRRGTGLRPGRGPPSRRRTARRGDDCEPAGGARQARRPHEAGRIGGRERAATRRGSSDRCGGRCTARDGRAPHASLGRQAGQAIGLVVVHLNSPTGVSGVPPPACIVTSRSSTCDRPRTGTSQRAHPAAAPSAMPPPSGSPGPRGSPARGHSGRTAWWPSWAAAWSWS